MQSSHSRRNTVKVFFRFHYDSKLLHVCSSAMNTCHAFQGVRTSSHWRLCQVTCLAKFFTAALAVKSSRECICVVHYYLSVLIFFLMHTARWDMQKVWPARECKHTLDSNKFFYDRLNNGLPAAQGKDKTLKSWNFVSDWRHSMWTTSL